MTELGFVAISFQQSEITRFVELTDQLVPANQYYYSEVIPRINGNVAAALHLTLYYGLHPETDLAQIRLLTSNTNLQQLELGGLSLFSGYQNMYQILVVTVRDATGQLLKLSEQIQSLIPEAEREKYTLKPHLTLAYVTNEFRLPEGVVVPDYLPIELIKIYK